MEFQRTCWMKPLTRSHSPWQCHSTNPRIATSRPLGERSEPCLATKRPTASDEVWNPTKDFFESLNKSLQLGIFPEDLRLANIVPIFFKKGKRDFEENYRPISLLPAISKFRQRCLPAGLGITYSTSPVASSMEFQPVDLEWLSSLVSYITLMVNLTLVNK